MFGKLVKDQNGRVDLSDNALVGLRTFQWQPAYERPPELAEAVNLEAQRSLRHSSGISDLRESRPREKSMNPIDNTGPRGENGKHDPVKEAEGRTIGSDNVPVGTTAKSTISAADVLVDRDKNMTMDELQRYFAGMSDEEWNQFFGDDQRW